MERDTTDGRDTFEKYPEEHISLGTRSETVESMHAWNKQ